MLKNYKSIAVMWVIRQTVNDIYVFMIIVHDAKRLLAPSITFFRSNQEPSYITIFSFKSASLSVHFLWEPFNVCKLMAVDQGK